MRPSIFFILIFLMLASTVQASAGLDGVVDGMKEKAISAFVEDLLSQKCWDGDWNVADKEGKPTKSVKTDRHIRAWIDIVGFREESILNGTRYVNESAKDSAIVKRKAWKTPINGYVVSFKTTYNIFDHSGNTTATTTTMLHWKYKVTTLFGSRWVHVYEGPLTVSYTTPSPERYDEILQEATAKIHVHNRSVNPVAYLTIPSMENLTLVRATYNGSSISRHDQLGRVITNDRGTELVEFTREDLPTWIKDENQSVIDHQGGAITIFDDAFNASLLGVVLVSPYGTRTVTDYEITEVNDRVSIPMILLKVVACGAMGAVLIYIVVGVFLRAL